MCRVMTRPSPSWRTTLTFASPTSATSRSMTGLATTSSGPCVLATELFDLMTRSRLRHRIAVCGEHKCFEFGAAVMGAAGQRNQFVSWWHRRDLLSPANARELPGGLGRDDYGDVRSVGFATLFETGEQERLAAAEG